MIMLDAATLLIFPALMIFAAFSDLFTMTISNRLSIALAVLFIPLALAGGFTTAEICWHLACGISMLILGFGLFAKGWIGGGDAKLAAATAIWLGFDHFGQYALAASALGGLLTLGLILIRNWPLPAFLSGREWIMRLHAPETGVLPYGIALAAAGLLLYPETAIWLAAASV
jgi:prepilin peptidase CpaA